MKSAAINVLVFLTVGINTASMTCNVGSCLIYNLACFDSEPFMVVQTIHNEFGCDEKCTETYGCNWWTWYDGSSEDHPDECHLFSSCPSRTVSCGYCWTGESSCFKGQVTSAAAVIGGADDQSRNVHDVEVLRGGSVSNGQTIADLPLELARREAASASVGVEIYICGGFTQDGEVSDRCLLYCAATDEGWEETVVPPMREARIGAVAAAAYGELYIIGGSHSNGENVSSMEIYNPAIGEWRRGPPMLKARSHACAVRVADSIYVIGGGSDVGVEVFNLTTLKWEPMEAKSSRRQHSCLFLDDGILVAGGVDIDGRIVAEVELYDLANKTFSSVASMTRPRTSFGLVQVNGRVTAVGGRGDAGVMDSTESLSGDRQRWTESEDLRLDVARAEFTVTSVSARDRRPPST